MITPYSGGKTPDQSRIPTRTMAGNEKARIWILGVLFIMVLGGFVGLQFWGSTARTGIEEEEEQGDIVGIVPPVGDDGRPAFKVVPQSPSERRDLVRNDIGMKLLEFVKSDKLVDGTTPDDQDVLKYLIDQTIWNTEVTRVGKPHYRHLEKELGDLKFDPGPFRGEFISAWGEVVELDEPMPFGGKVDSVEQLYGVLFRQADGTLYHVLATVPIEREPGDWIQVFGIFYRLRTMTVDGQEEPVLELVLVKDKEVFKAYPPVSVKELDPKWADQIFELRNDEANNTDERPFWLTMNYVRELGREGYNQLRETPDFRIADFGRLAKPILAKKDELRFKFVSMRGSLIQDVVDIQQSDNPGKIKRVDTAILLQPTEYLVFLASPRPWSEYGIKLGEEYVQVEGIFYKRWAYIPKAGPPAREIPMIIVTGIYPVDPEVSPLMVFVQYAIVGLVFLVVGTFFLLALRDRKRVRDFRADYRNKKRERSDARHDGSGSGA